MWIPHGVFYIWKNWISQKNISQKYGVPFDIVRKGDILNNSEIMIKDVFNPIGSKKSDIFPFSKNPDDNGYLA